MHSYLCQISTYNRSKLQLIQINSNAILYSQHFTFHWKLLVFCQNSPKLTSTIHPIRCAVALGTSTCCQLKVVLPSKRKGLFTAHSLSESVGISKVSFLSVDSERNKCLFPEGVGGGGYFWEFLVWVYRPVLQILNLFQIKKM